MADTRRPLPDFFFYGGVALLFTHELDAVLRAEWRLLFLLGGLPEAQASAWFIGLHLPLFLAALYLGNASARSLRLGFRALASAFLVVHAGLHLYLADDPRNAFEGWLSAAYIYLAAAFGAAYLLSVLVGSPADKQQHGGE